jgi:hypothetical protein
LRPGSPPGTLSIVLDLWSQKSSLKERVREVERELQAPGAKLAIRAPIGAGRHSIVAQLAGSIGAAVVEFPSYGDLDAPLHGFVQLAGHAGTLAAEPETTSADLLEPTRRAAQVLADTGRALVVLMPVSHVHTSREREATTRQHIERMLGVLVSLPALRVAVIASPQTRLRDGFTRQLALPLQQVGAAQIRADQLPDQFAVAARALAEAMARHNWACSPLQVRLQVGLIALGERPDSLDLPLEALAHRLVEQLQRWRTLKLAVHRLVHARRALPADVVATVSEVELQWRPLLTACIGYGDHDVRVPEVTRQVLLETLKLEPTTVEDAHAKLARYHASLDGACTLRGLGQDPALHWLEKVHHLALGGVACEAAWRQQVPAGREQLWERARHLSHVQRRFDDAAQTYKACIERFGDDPYSQHYLAYNVEHAGGDLGEVRRGYAAAVASEPSNPWWQQRWIRYLIAHGTLVEARAAWRLAIPAIDPDGSKLRGSPWLARNLHYWVARRWLELGRIEDAREVLSEVPQPWLGQEAELRELDALVASHQQALIVGESVYPASAPLDDRWRRPRSLPLTRAGRALERWAPGRVVEASAAEVTVVVAPTPDDAQQLTFDATTWRQLTGDPAQDAAGYFELGAYDDGEQIIRSVPDRGSWFDTLDAELLARVTA